MNSLHHVRILTFFSSSHSLSFQEGNECDIWNLISVFTDTSHLLIPVRTKWHEYIEILLLSWLKLFKTKSG